MKLSKLDHQAVQAFCQDYCTEWTVDEQSFQTCWSILEIIVLKTSLSFLEYHWSENLSQCFLISNSISKSTGALIEL